MEIGPKLVISRQTCHSSDSGTWDSGAVATVK
jgi:hypothetical protein